MATLTEGMVVKGTVTSVREFGAFVSIGAIEGLIPISEIGWERVEDIQGALSVGQEVEVAITRLDWANRRFSFSLKKTLADPWKPPSTVFPRGPATSEKSRAWPHSAHSSPSAGVSTACSTYRNSAGESGSGARARFSARDRKSK